MATQLIVPGGTRHCRAAQSTRLGQATTGIPLGDAQKRSPLLEVARNRQLTLFEFVYFPKFQSSILASVPRTVYVAHLPLDKSSSATRYSVCRCRVLWI